MPSKIVEEENIKKLLVKFQRFHGLLDSIFYTVEVCMTDEEIMQFDEILSLFYEIEKEIKMLL